MNILKSQINSLLFLTVFFALIKPNVFLAQMSSGGRPISFSNNSCLPFGNINTSILPFANMDSLRTADSISQIHNPNKSPRLGLPITVSLNVNNSGTWETLADSSKIWRLHIVSPNAKYLILFYSQFWLPPNSHLFVYNQDRSNIIGAFTELNNKPNGKFSTAPIKGESIMLEYYQSKGVTQQVNINISTILFIAQAGCQSGSGGFGCSSSCMINVKCPEGNDWCDQRRSVAMIIGATGRWATGSLITNEKNDSRPYFLTCEHAVDEIDDGNSEDYVVTQNEINEAEQWQFLFNYQSSGCSNPPSEPSLMYSLSGATLRAHRYKTDFALFELLESPPGGYNVFYNGFNNKNERPENGVCIHHPRGDIKKISVYGNTEPNRDDCQNPGLNVPGAHKTWKVKWDKGDTQPGSSGSPLFDEDKRVVGQLFGVADKNCESASNTACKPDRRSFFGRFDLSWDDGNSSSNRLKDWLSPNSTPQAHLIKANGFDPCQPSYFFTNANDLHTSANVNLFTNTAPFPGDRSYNGVYLASGNIQTGANVTIQNATTVKFYGNQVILGVGFSALSGCGFTASPTPCLGGCNTGVGRMSLGGGESVPNLVVIGPRNTFSPEDGMSEKTSQIIVSEKIVLFPNPSNGQFTLLTSMELNETYSVKICDYLSRTIFSQDTITGTSFSIDLSSQSKGVYFINIIKKDKAYFKKVILQ